MVANKLAFITNSQPNEKKRYTIPRLYARTNFKRSDHPGRPVFILAATYEDKRVSIPDHCEDLLFDELVPLLSDIIIEYHKERNGNTRFWGEITGYYYQDYKQDAGIEFDIDGNVVRCVSIDSDKYTDRVKLRF